MNIWSYAFHIFIYQIMEIWSPRIKKKCWSGNRIYWIDLKEAGNIWGIQIYIMIIFPWNLKPWLLHSMNTFNFAEGLVRSELYGFVFTPEFGQYVKEYLW
jgi:hypothetical protein